MWRLTRPDAVTVWKRPEVKRLMSRYVKIMDGKTKAKYLVAKRVPAALGVDGSTSDLWDEHHRLSKEFRELLSKIDDGSQDYEKMKTPRFSYLDLKAELAHRMIEACHLCERRCGKNRKQEGLGVCELDHGANVTSAFLHMGEEAPLIPSGTIFFSSCTFKCVFCQNYDISTNPLSGRPVNSKELSIIATKLYSKGAHNINYVGGEPTPNTHVILDSMRHQVSNVAQLWNSNMYCSKKTMRLLWDVIDIWLPDFKYGNDDCGKTLSKVDHYWDIVSRNHQEAYDQTVALGTSSMIIRHLIMPTHISCCTEPLLKWISKNTPDVMVNIMEQYRPEHQVPYTPAYQDINRRITQKEYEQSIKLADQLGIVWQPVS